MEPMNYRAYDRQTDTWKSNFSSELPLRPGTNTAGKQIQIRVNQFKVTQWPGKDIYQYDVSYQLLITFDSIPIFTFTQILIGNGAEKRGLVKRVWESRTVQRKLQEASKHWLWDGNKIAWYVFSSLVYHNSANISKERRKATLARDTHHG